MAEHDKAVRRVPGDLRKETKAEARVIRLPIERLDEAADLFARSFHTNPNFMDLLPDERARRSALSRRFEASLRDASGFGHVYAATREAESSARDGFGAVALGWPSCAF